MLAAFRPALFILAAMLALGGCSDAQNGPVLVSVIGQSRELAEPLRYSLSPAGKLMLESTAQGLVAFDAEGDVLPALAQRWIVQDDGRSYIFRLRRARWANGARIDAKDIAALLKIRIAANLAYDRHGDLSAIQDVTAMTGEVIEITLSVPRPYLLQMLAQPQMAITRRDGGTGPYRKDKRPNAWFLSPVTELDSEEAAAIPAWQNRVVRAERAAKAITRFRMGLATLVLGGRYSDLPLLNRVKLDKQDVRIDPVQGLFGLALSSDTRFFKDADVREAISMAIDRNRLPAAFALGGWAVTDQLIPQQLDLPRSPSAPRWSAITIEERRTLARNAIVRWRAANGSVPILRIALPTGSGSRLLFALVASDLARIGVPARQVSADADADLRLIDEVAPYDSALWYLSRISCARKVHCSAITEERMNEAELATTTQDVQAKLAEAEALTVAHNGYIPLGAPVRWSLVARYLDGFSPSTRARHPLNHLFRATN